MFLIKSQKILEGVWKIIVLLKTPIVLWGLCFSRAILLRKPIVSLKKIIPWSIFYSASGRGGKKKKVFSARIPRALQHHAKIPHYCAGNRVMSHLWQSQLFFRHSLSSFGTNCLTFLCLNGFISKLGQQRYISSKAQNQRLICCQHQNTNYPASLIQHGTEACHCHA